MKTLIVNKKYDNKKLNNFILDSFPNLSQNTLFKALRKKDIRVNDKRVSENVTIYENDEIKVFISDELLEGKLNLNIIYEDDNILVINKSTNLEVTGDNSLTTILEKKYTFIKPCHRIDRNTTGLVLFAKNQEALDILLDKFKNREIEKHYLATVYGIPKVKKIRLEAYLFKDNKKSIVYISDTPKTGYQKIITSYKVIDENKKDNTSILDIELETGRTHQIRAHLAHVGYPILGDGKYGINEINKKFNQKTQLLQSNSIKFTFKTPSGILEYLTGKEIKL
ncbi:MAG: RluA family pseudouridine synthase [Clostridia bacterium]|nr:RluA family pseudouridine synthase [Clostridia bacterium]